MQDTTHGADPGRAVDDLTASGTNGRTPIREKLTLPTLDDSVEMEKFIGTRFRGTLLNFWKQDFLKAFRQIPGDRHSRRFGSFGVKNPKTGQLEFFTHLGLLSGLARVLYCFVV